MPSDPTIGDLRRKAIVTDDAIDAAVDAFLADSKAGPADLGGGYTVGVAAAIQAHPPSRDALPGSEDRPAYRRTLVRTAVLLAVAGKG